MCLIYWGGGEVGRCVGEVGISFKGLPPYTSLIFSDLTFTSPN